MLKSIYIQNIRNISELQFECSEGFNWFIGQNGAGKTSILESLSILLNTKSFRAHKSKVFVQHDQKSCLVRGAIERVGSGLAKGGEFASIAVSKSRDGTAIYRQNGENVSAGDYIQCTPAVQIIAPEAENLVDAGAQERRKFLDFGVFHVKHQFLAVWRQYNRLLKQRNAVLRERHLDRLLLKSIDQQWLPTAEALNSARVEYWESFSDYLINFGYSELQVALASEGRANAAEKLAEIEIKFRPGWAAGKSLREAIEDGVQSDHRMGFTQSGPHRADLHTLIGGIPAVDVLSRGQKKIFQVWLKLKQSAHLASAYGKKTLFIVDDIGAELDQERTAWAYAQMAAMSHQVFGTSITVDPTLEPYLNSNTSMFHVKHGQITQSSTV